jgi:hypothetical protein
MQLVNISATINEAFSLIDVFETKDLYSLLGKIYPELSDKTIAWKINQLKNEKIIFQVGRGLYSLTYLPEFEPSLSLKTKRFFNKIDRKSYGELIVWDTSILDSLLTQNSEKSWIFILAPKTDLENLFSDLQQFSKPIFLNPDREITTRYVLPHTEAVILLPSISQMPTTAQNDFTMPTIEAILVNIWLDFERYFQPLGYDLKTLFEISFKKFNINRSKLLRYAARRDKREAVEEFIDTLN